MQIAARYHAPLLSHHHQKAHTNEQVSQLFTDWTKITHFGCYFSWYVTSASFSHQIVCFLQCSLLHNCTMDVCHFFIILALTWGTVHYICVMLNDKGSMLILRPELSNVVACDQGERNAINIAVHWMHTTNYTPLAVLKITDSSTAPGHMFFSPKPENSLSQSAPNLFSDSQLFHGTIWLARAITSSWHPLWVWLSLSLCPCLP